MALKKGQKICSVFIDHGIVTAHSEDGLIPLTRHQRHVLADWRNPNYIENICKEFSRKEPLTDEFSVTVDGNKVFQL